MATIRRSSTIAILIVCFLASQLGATVFACDEGAASTDPAVAAPVAVSTTLPPSTMDRFRLSLDKALVAPELTSIRPQSAFAQRRGYYGGRRGRHTAVTAIALGAVGTIAGGAVLAYANRPDCNVSPNANGCGYGTKVVGGAVLSAGIVGLVVGALMWR